MLQMIIKSQGENKNKDVSEILKNQFEVINKNLKKGEDEIFYRVLAISVYNGKYPKELMKNLLINKMGPIEYKEHIDSLKNKKILVSNGYIETFHPVVCKGFINLKPDLNEILFYYLNEFVEAFNENYDIDILNSIGVNLVINGEKEKNNKLENNKLEIALKFFDKLIIIKGDSIIAWFNKGFILNILRRYQEAIECFDRLIELRGEDNAEAWLFKGLALADLKRYEEAIECYDKAIELRGGDYAEAWGLKGILLSKLKKYEEAIECFDNEIELSGGNNAEIWFLKGNALAFLGKYEEAIECFNKAIELRGGNYTMAWFLKKICIIGLSKKI